MIRKILIALTTCVVVIYAIVAFNLPFRLWPTFLEDHQLTVTQETISKLQDLRNTKKFLPDAPKYYPGQTNEMLRVEIESLMNGLIDRIIAGLPKAPQKSYVLSQFKTHLPAFDKFDSEERDRVCSYLEEIMDIVGIESSSGLINVWRYGFPF